MLFRSVAIILNDKNEILISLRKNEPAKGTWDFPGGFCETEETAEESVAREVKEETTLDVESVKYLFSVPNIYPYSGMNIHTMDLFFLCKVSVYDVTAHDDVEELKWVSIDSLKPEMFGLKSISEAVPRIKEILRR